MDEQTHRVALVTGGTSGIGRAVATELAGRGWSIFAPHAPSADVDDIVADIQRSTTQGAEVIAGPADLDSADGRDLLVEQVLEAFGQVDMLVNAAGGPPDNDDLLELPEDAYRHVMDHTLTTPLFLTQLIANEMVRLAESGQIENPKIVTLNTISAYTTSVDHAAHCLARSALAMMTRLFADRLAEHGINVYEIRVGLISAGAADAAHAKYNDLIAEGLTPIRRWGRAQDVARAVAAVAEDMLNFSTGQIIDVDGGFHLRRL